MPYKDPKHRAIYAKGYYAGARFITLAHLGNKCEKCGSLENLEIDHITPLNRRARSIKDLMFLENLRVLCRDCNTNRGFKSGKA